MMNAIIASPLSPAKRVVDRQDVASGERGAPFGSMRGIEQTQSHVDNVHDDSIFVSTMPNHPLHARSSVSPALLDNLRATAPAVDSTGKWPHAQLQGLADAGVLRWNIPRTFGGDELSPVEMTAAYEQLAAACLTTTFILTQRNAACQRIADSANTALKTELLPKLATGKLFATVGISHLTTSRQHLATPPVQIRFEGDAYCLDGAVPWVTGAEAADDIVTGGAGPDGRQMLFALPRTIDGLTVVTPPTRLLALNGSRTSSIVLENVTASRNLVLAGPVEGVISRAPGGAGSVTTSALAVGLAARALNDLAAESRQRPELAEVVNPFRQELDELRTDMYATVTARPGAAVVPVAVLRQRANSLVLRVTQAHLAASKGAGYVSGHPAERAVREALFFLVWSCPQPVVAAALREFACLTE
jgi:alkylation response protein AidB-like acyl-CoA dehydrogenase